MVDYPINSISYYQSLWMIQPKLQIPMEILLRLAHHCSLPSIPCSLPRIPQADVLVPNSESHLRWACHGAVWNEAQIMGDVHCDGMDQPNRVIATKLRRAFNETKMTSFWQISLTGCTESCQNDNLYYSQWRIFHQNDDIYVSVLEFHICYHFIISPTMLNHL